MLVAHGAVQGPLEYTYNIEQYQNVWALFACFKGARYLLIIHEVLVAMDLFSAGVQDETLEEESQRLASY